MSPLLTCRTSLSPPETQTPANLNPHMWYIVVFTLNDTRCRGNSQCNCMHCIALKWYSGIRNHGEALTSRLPSAAEFCSSRMKTYDYYSMEMQSIFLCVLPTSTWYLVSVSQCVGLILCRNIPLSIVICVRQIHTVHTDKRQDEREQLVKIVWTLARSFSP